MLPYKGAILANCAAFAKSIPSWSDFEAVEWRWTSAIFVVPCFRVKNWGKPHLRECRCDFRQCRIPCPQDLFLPRLRTARLPRARILKSHEYFDPRYKRVVFVVRDPRDVALSMYYYSIKRQNIPDGYAMEEFVPRFMTGDFLEDWGSWDEPVASWRATRERKSGFLLLRYEDMLSDPATELTRVRHS